MAITKTFDFIERYSFYAFAFFCCFPQKISSVFFIIWGCLFILGKVIRAWGGERIFVAPRKQQFCVYLLLGFMLWGLATALYADNGQLVLKRIFEQRLCLFLLPIFFLLGGRRCDFKQVLRYFILGNLTFIITSLIFIGQRYWIGQDIDLLRDFLTYATIIFGEMLHRTYSNMNIIIALIGLVFLLKNGRRQSDRHLAYVFLPAAFFFFIVNNSRAETLALMVLAAIYIAFLSMKSKKIALSAICAMLLLGGAVFVFFPQNRMVETITLLANGDESRPHDPRYHIWQSATQLIAEKPILGYGVNNFQETLTQHYNDTHFYDGYLHNYGPHNQFLEEALEYGLGGALLLLALLVCFARFCREEERKFWLGCAILLFVTMLFESILSRYSGCATFALLTILHSFGREEDAYECPLTRKPVLIAAACLVALGAGSYCLATLDNRYDVGKSYLNTSLFQDETITGKVYRLRKDKLNKTVVRLTDGTLVDHTIYYKTFAYFHLRPGQKATFTIDCYVSSDFVGKIVQVTAEDIYGGTIASDCYNLWVHGQWHTLSFETTNTERIVLLVNIVMNESTNQYYRGSIILKNPKLTIE